MFIESKTLIYVLESLSNVYIDSILEISSEWISELLLTPIKFQSSDSVIDIVVSELIANATTWLNASKSPDCVGNTWPVFSPVTGVQFVK